MSSTPDRTDKAIENTAVESAAAEPRKTGPEVISAYLKRLPGAPGVYRMMDPAGNVLYVGKARNLKNRVGNYARLGGHTNRIARMIASTASMEFVVTKTESEALLLEANLIKRFRPRFNVLMRDDKSFPYILIARDHPAPQILKHRGARNRKGDYFCPFASAGAVDHTINTLQRAFLLRSCSDSVFESRTRPCLLHQIKRCSAPCTGEISPEAYGELVAEAVRFLRGESQTVRKHLQQLMQEASDKLEFERAAEFRNRLRAVSHVTSDQNINPEGIEEADVFAAFQDSGFTCIQVFFFRTGQNWGNRAYFPRADRALGVEEVLESFIVQFYDDKPVPRLILASHALPGKDLLAEALSLKAERKVEVWTPQRGEKRAIVEHAVANAREAHGRWLAESSSQRRLLEGVAKAFGLPTAPRRIEVYDNSHIQGAHAVGAMIVAGPEGLVKGQYRKFNIKSEAGAAGDDYGMMREVLTRRFKRLVVEGDGEVDAASPSDSDLASDRTAADAANGLSDTSVPLPHRGEGTGVKGTAGRGLAAAKNDLTLFDASAPSPHPTPSRGGEESPLPEEQGEATQSAAQMPGLISPQPLSRGRDDDAERDDVGDEDVEQRAAVSSSSRLEQPAPPPLKERGADGNAFGVLRAAEASDPPGVPSESDDDGPATLEAFPDRPDLVLIDGGSG